jgi:Protein of unknown function (DUF3455)
VNHLIAPKKRATRMLPLACATALAAILTISPTQPAHAKKIEPPAVPAGLAPDAGSRAFLVGHASGTQNYVCLPSGAGFAWTLFTPQATLFDGHGKQLTTHFFSPNPFENGTVRPAWQHSRDTSTVWVKLNTSSTDPAFVAPDAIAWFLLDVTGSAAGPNGGDKLGATTQIQRVNTVGGKAPASGCSAAANVGDKAFVPYTADYYFYTNAEAEREED